MSGTVPESSGPVAPIVAAVRDLVAKCNDGRYAFKRGPVLYEDWKYDVHPWVWSLQFDDTTLFRPINDANVAFDLSTKMLEGLLDDGVLDQMRGHVYQVVDGLRRAKRPGHGNDALLIGTFAEEGACIEFYDADLRVQGVTFTFRISF